MMQQVSVTATNGSNITCSDGVIRRVIGEGRVVVGDHLWSNGLFLFSPAKSGGRVNILSGDVSRLLFLEVDDTKSPAEYSLVARSFDSDDKKTTKLVPHTGYKPWFFVALGKDYYILWVDVSKETPETADEEAQDSGENYKGTGGMSPAIMEHNGRGTAFQFRTKRVRATDRLDAQIVNREIVWTVPRFNLKYDKYIGSTSMVALTPEKGCFDYYRGTELTGTIDLTAKLAAMRPSTAPSIGSIVTAPLVLPKHGICYVMQMGSESYVVDPYPEVVTYHNALKWVSANIVDTVYWWQSWGEPPNTISADPTTFEQVIGKVKVTEKHDYTNTIKITFKIEIEGTPAFDVPFPNPIFGMGRKNGVLRVWAINPLNGDYEVYAEQTQNSAAETKKGTFGPSLNRTAGLYLGALPSGKAVIKT